MYKRQQLRRREERRSERKNAKTAGKPADRSKELQKPHAVEPGTKVRIKGQDAVGEVIGLSGKRATVGFGQILTTIDLNRLEPISNAEYKKATRELRPAAPPTNFSTAERRLQFHEQIDVRGMRVAEAVETVDVYKRQDRRSASLRYCQKSHRRETACAPHCPPPANRPETTASPNRRTPTNRRRGQADRRRTGRRSREGPRNRARLFPGPGRSRDAATSRRPRTNRERTRPAACLSLIHIYSEVHRRPLCHVS